MNGGYWFLISPPAPTLLTNTHIPCKHTLTMFFLIQCYCRLAEEVADELVEEAGEELESILRGYAEDVFAWL